MARSYGTNDSENESNNNIQVKWYKNPAILLGMFMLLIFLGVSAANIISAIHSSNDVANQCAEMQTEYDELVSQIEELQKNPSYTEEGAKEALHTASVEGKLIADAQNGWMAIPLGESVKISEEEKTELVTEYHDTMVKYCPNSDVEIKRIWFTYVSDSIESLPYKWEFNSMYSYAGDTIPVMWTLFNGDDLYAYVIGNYDVATKTFSNLKLYYTSIGSTAMAEFNQNITPADTGSPTDATATDATTESTESSFVDDDAEKYAPTTEATTEVTTENTSEENTNPNDVTTEESSEGEVTD